MKKTWVVGEHYALVRPQVVVVVSADVAITEILQMWERLDVVAPDGLGGLLDVLAEVTGRAVRALPDFAMALLDEQGLHLAVRGCFDAEITLADASTTTMRGSEVSTWAERNFVATLVSTVRLGGAGTGSVVVPRLPAIGGVFPVQDLRLVLSEEGRFDDMPTAPPVRVQEPSGPAVPVASAPHFISGVPSAGSRPSAGPVLTTQQSDGALVHHDGHTQMQLPDSTGLDAHVAGGSPGSGQDGPLVLGLLCGSGHANPTHRTDCRVCGLSLSGEGVRMPIPPLGWLHTSAGESIELVQNVVAGRDPRASRIEGAAMPRLLPLPHSHVSGTHVEIRLEGWSVLVADLRSTNGTFLQRAGQPVLRISATPQLLVSGDVVQLGHGVDLRFEELP